MDFIIRAPKIPFPGTSIFHSCPRATSRLPLLDSITTSDARTLPVLIGPSPFLLSIAIPFPLASCMPTCAKRQLDAHDDLALTVFPLTRVSFRSVRL